MEALLATLIQRLTDFNLADTTIIPWSCPILSFGNPQRAKVATLGLNPSNLEFVDLAGRELVGESRRFPTLSSLGLSRWADVDASHLELMLRSYRNYFLDNPYDGWFGKLEQLISGLGVSYYGASAKACHLDLVPFATKGKWTSLGTSQRESLMERTGLTLGYLLRDAPIQVLVLNGSAVVNSFQRLAGVELRREFKVDWALPRKGHPHVFGIAFTGQIKSFAGINLGRNLSVAGFNHNIQSSYGVTADTMRSIRHWMASEVAETFE